MAGTGSFDITSLRPGWPTIGNFVPKFSRSGFGNSLTHSNLRPTNARSELFLDGNQTHSAASCDGEQGPGSHHMEIIRHARKIRLDKLSRCWPDSHQLRKPTF